MQANKNVYIYMSTKKVLINKNDAGFGLSREAHEMFLKKANIPFTRHTSNFKTILLKTSELDYHTALLASEDLDEVKRNYIHQCADIPRDHPALLEVADFFGISGMNDRFSKLEFVEVPEDKPWSIKKINGIEYISVNPNPVAKFSGTCEHWYASDFRPPWMDDAKDIVVVVGIDRHDLVTSMICAWGAISAHTADWVTYKWYPLTKLCSFYTTK
jgi:hypothetical protein